MEPVPANLNFAQTEEEILKFWEKVDAFKTSLKKTEGKPVYTFYDGPPFATGLPHYGHLLAGTIKDTITRFYSQKGNYVARRFGWDCHGLPIEFEIEKELGIKTKDQVLEYGIPNYNAACRSIVMKYSEEWKKTVTRLGRWIDMENNYKTMDLSFMESVWWVFKQLWDKDMVYRGIKVLPYSTGCTTVLSNFEAGMNYKDTQDPEVYVAFQSEDDANVHYIAWTTTPWTLPSNLALCVNPRFTYIKVEDVASKKHYVFLKERLEALYPTKKPAKGKPAEPLAYKVLEEFSGDSLEGKKYLPLFDYFKDHPKAFQIITSTYVKNDSGSGIVHQAPAFGEEDYKTTLKFGIIEKGGVVPCPVDENGRFFPIVKEFAGQYVKDADKPIIAHLKAQGRIFRSGTITHSYPFCWRSDQPLLYKSVPCWFVRVEDVKEKLLKNNADTYWVPEFIQTKRFQNWLSEAHDWAVSRSRYWGTPLPVWANADFSEVIAVGSIDELEKLSGVRVTDLHRESIDHIVIPSQKGEGHPELRRIEDVFDCWFESGSMPYAQQHYPFENKEVFENGFPADFIAEGVDQTRGWFYTLLVISTILFDKPPFKNLIANGLVLAEDGKKMSKRLKNYPDPTDIINQYGADALRMYLINSPVVRGETLCFKGAGVHGIIRDVLLPLFNAYRFLTQSVLVYEQKSETKFTPDFSKALESTSLMDKWILAATQTLVEFVRQEMEAYRLYTVVPQLVRFIAQLTNWYVRLNRSRLRGTQADTLSSLNTLFEVLVTVCKTMAPFIPFFTEYIYQNLRRIIPDAEESVHYCEFPVPKSDAQNTDIQLAVSLLQSIIEQCRSARERRRIGHRQPLSKIVIFVKSNEAKASLESLMDYLYQELNVKEIEFCLAADNKMVEYIATANFSVLGKRVGKQMKEMAAAIKLLTQEQLQQFVDDGSIDVLGHKLTEAEVVVSRKFTGDVETYEPSSAQEVAVHPHVSIALIVALTPELVQEGTVRNVVNKIQRLRKEAGVQVTDHIAVYFKTESADLAALLTAQQDTISERIGRSFSNVDNKPEGANVIDTSTADAATYTVENDLFKGQSVVFEIVRL